MTTKKSKTTPESFPAQNLRSANKNADTTDTNRFASLENDDVSHSSTLSHSAKLDNLTRSMERMTDSFNDRFELMLDAIGDHSILFRKYNMHLNTDLPPASLPINACPEPTTDPTEFLPETKTPHGIDFKTDPKDTASSSVIPQSTSSAPFGPPVTPSCSIPSIFGQNEFSLIINDTKKIKYLSMETYLKDKSMPDDSVRSIEQMYNDIVMSLTFVFEQDLPFIPSYSLLSRDIDFDDIFLKKLHGITLKKCQSVFTRLGSILKSRLTSPTFISTMKCPKTAIVIRANPLATGWTLLQKILCDRLIICGGIPDYDLDSVRATLAFYPQESYIDFYIRTQHLLNEYDLCYTNKTFVPTIKITNTFITELNRAPEYVPLLTSYHEKMIRHIKSFGDVDNSYPLPFDIHEVYDLLHKMNASLIPSSLRPQRKIPSLHQSTLVPPPSPKDGYTEFIACLEVTIDEDCTQPSICAKMSTNKQRCQACLLGFHRELDCYLRGPNFQPSDLKRRLKIYNQINGDAPPSSHSIREYNPRGKEAVHPNPKQKSTYRPNPTAPTNSPSENQVSFSMKKPFSNFATKSKNQLKPNINSLESTTDAEPDNAEDFDPTITSFMSSQIQFDTLNIDTESPYDDNPTICMQMAPQKHPKSGQQKYVPNYTISNFTDISSRMSAASDNTPQKLLDVIHDSHIVRRLRPSKAFLRQHCLAIEKLSINYFQPFCNATFHVDGGANCGGVNDKRLFYFYINTKSEIEQVGGDHVHSPGWGGILVNINNKVHLLAPVYYCPRSPRNTLSTTSMIQFCAYNEAIVNTNKHLQITDTRMTTSRLPFDIHNDLDHLTLSVISLKPNLGIQHSINNTVKDDETPPTQVIACASTHPRRSPRLQLLNQVPTSQLDKNLSSNNLVINNNSTPEGKFNTMTSALQTTSSSSTLTTVKPNHPCYNIVINENVIATLPRSVVSHIAAMFIHLHKDVNPRNTAIKQMNGVLNNYLGSSDNTLQNIPKEPVINDQYLTPVIANFSRSWSRNSSPTHDWIRIHFGLIHASPTMMKNIINKDILTDIPTSLRTKHSFHCSCYICMATKTNKLPRGRSVDKSHLKPFERLHIDFSFFGETSIRGFTTALDITCGSTSYPFGFPCRAKTPPLEIVRWVISTIRTMGYTVLFIRVDEDSSLANSSEFCTLVQDMNCLLETTGGGNSTNNGMVESGNRSRGNMVRSILSTMNVIFGHELPSDIKMEAFWCFAYQHACFIQRRLFNRLRNESPYFLVHNSRASILECIIPGSIMTIIDPNKNLKQKLDRSRTTRGYFLGYANNCKIRLYYDPKHPTKIKRSAHCIIEDVATLSVLMKTVPSLDLSTTPEKDIPIPPKILDKIILPDSLHITDDPFPDAERTTITINLPPPTESIGLTVKNDPLYNMPYIHHCVPGSRAHRAIPPGKRRNHFITGIGNDSPITARFVIDQLKAAQLSDNNEIKMELIRRPPVDGCTTLAGTRAMFDTFPSILHNRPVIASQHFVPTDHDNFISAPSKPSRPRTIFEAFKSPFKRNWKAAAWNQFKKNHQIAVFSIPFPAKDLPKDARVFQSQLIPEIKNTDVAGVYELKIRDVIIGTPQIKKIDFTESYSPTVDPVTIKIQIALAASRHYIIGVIDVKNAFQNTIASPNQRIYVSASKLYLEWASIHLGFKYNPDEKYLRQMLNSNQGTKNAGHLWYNLLTDIIQKYGLIRSTVDHGYFVKDLGDDLYLLISLATDDLLVACPSYAVFNDLVEYLRQYFELTIQNGNVIKFLGLRIIQSSECITIDQGEYTFEIIEYYFGTAVDRVKTLSSPMRYDSDYERDLHDALPLSPSQLKIAIVKYKGGYRFWTGKFIHLCTQTRPDICYATQKLSEYNNSPTEVAFESIVRVLRYQSTTRLNLSLTCLNL